jgi:hypothetical protein
MRGSERDDGDAFRRPRRLRVSALGVGYDAMMRFLDR